MIIDMHTHCFPDPLAKKAMPMLAMRSGNPYPAFDGTASGLRESVISGGADRAAVLNIATNAHQQTKVNDFTISLLGDSVLIPFGSVHFESPDAISELDRLHDAGIKGIKLHPDYPGFFADDERMFPIYEKIGSLGMITVFHAGVDIGVPDPVHCTPQMLKKILPRFGGAPVIAAHMGGFLLWRGSCSIRLGQSLERDRARARLCPLARFVRRRNRAHPRQERRKTARSLNHFNIISFTSARVSTIQSAPAVLNSFSSP